MSFALRPRRAGAGFWTLVLAVCAAPLALPVSAQVSLSEGPSSLTLEEAVRLAREHNPDYRTQQSQVRSANIAVSNARGALMPNASVSNSYGYQGQGERRAGDVVLGTQPSRYSSSYSLNLSYSLSGESLLRPGQAETEARAAEARVRGAGIALDAEVTNAYLSALEADAQVVQARNALERTTLTVEQATAQVEVGVATPLDIRRAEVQQAQAEVVLVNSENDAAAARATLAQVVGVVLDEDVDLVTGFGLFEPELDSEALLDRALDGNPVIRASRLSHEASKTDVRTAQSRFFPTISMSAGISGSVFQAGTLDPLIEQALNTQAGRYDSCLEDNRIRELLGDSPRDCTALDPTRSEVEASIRESVRVENSGFPFDYDRNPLSLSLNVSLPLFTGFSRKNQVESARVAASNAEEQVRTEELRLRSEVATAVRNVETARRTVELQARIRETSTEELDLAQERFALGLASSIEVADAQANLSQAERDEITALYQFHRSIVALEGLIGGPIR
ncbi:MAG: TolC family protein [Gemmatimonadota bacterium]|nr:TolC family protein [Gemmatimonadota bacterium]